MRFRVARVIAQRNAYQRHVANMFRLIGEDADTAARNAERVLAIETDLAKASLERVRRRDPRNLDHPFRRDELAGLTRNFAWDRYFASLGEPPTQRLNVGWPEFFRGFDALLAGHDMGSLKAYLRWHLLIATAQVLPKAFVAERFDFQGRTLGGAREERARWKRCVTQTNAALGEELGKVYVAGEFGARASFAGGRALNWTD